MKTKDGERVVIDGVDGYQVLEPMFEGIRVILTHRGESYSPAYIQGISGAAFRIAGICPCAPTCSSQMSSTDLIKLLGYEATEAMLGWKDDNVTSKRKTRLGEHSVCWLPRRRESERSKGLCYGGRTWYVCQVVDMERVRRICGTN